MWELFHFYLLAENKYPYINDYLKKNSLHQAQNCDTKPDLVVVSFSFLSSSTTLSVKKNKNLKKQENNSKNCVDIKPGSHRYFSE